LIVCFVYRAGVQKLQYLKSVKQFVIIVYSYLIIIMVKNRKKNQQINKYQFCISVLGHINMLIIGTGNKISISVNL